MTMVKRVFEVLAVGMSFPPIDIDRPEIVESISQNGARMTHSWFGRSASVISNEILDRRRCHTVLRFQTTPLRRSPLIKVIDYHPPKAMRAEKANWTKKIDPWTDSICLFMKDGLWKCFFLGCNHGQARSEMRVLKPYSNQFDRSEWFVVRSWSPCLSSKMPKNKPHSTQISIRLNAIFKLRHYLHVWIWRGFGCFTLLIAKRYRCCVKCALASHVR